MGDTFSVIAEPSRRRILDLLLQCDCSVSELVRALDLAQPRISKHLRVLRECGLVSSRVEAQRRIYSIDDRPLVEVDAWLSAFRASWDRRLDALGAHLDKRSVVEEN
jgi:DNA-binding transcriptional ArsR family regulator